MFDPENPKCPVCHEAMWDNRTTKKGKQPDYKCKNENCKWQQIPDGSWVNSQYGTSIWLDNYKEGSEKNSAEVQSDQSEKDDDRQTHIDRIALLKSMIESGKTPLECNTMLPTYLKVLDGTFQEK